jgi:hypothetical protein
VVVEDQALDRFAWLVLKELGFSSREVFIRSDYPKRGGGSGKQYVEDRYRVEIVTFRGKRHENVALLLATEADAQAVVDRARSLDAQALAAGQPRRGPDDRIVYWIPKWHIETWGLHLTGVPVREDAPCKDKADRVDWREASRSFVAEYHARKSMNFTTLDSLATAYDETHRLGV